MDLIAHQFPEALVDELVAGDRTLALELEANDERLVVRAVANDFDDCVVEAGLDQFAYFVWIHGIHM